MKSIKLNATSLRMLLITAFIIVSFALVGGFYYAHDWLKRFAAESNINMPESTVTTQQSLNPTQTASSQKASNLILSSVDYFEKIKVDINKYATDNNITVNINEAPQDVISGITDQPIAGIQSKYLVVSFNGPINFTDFLKFINGLETNQPKIKVTGVNMNRVKDSSGSVTVSPITLKVYTR